MNNQKRNGNKLKIQRDTIDSAVVRVFGCVSGLLEPPPWLVSHQPRCNVKTLPVYLLKNQSPFPSFYNNGKKVRNAPMDCWPGSIK